MSSIENYVILKVLPCWKKWALASHQVLSGLLQSSFLFKCSFCLFFAQPQHCLKNGEKVRATAGMKHITKQYNCFSDIMYQANWLTRHTWVLFCCSSSLSTSNDSIVKPPSIRACPMSWQDSACPQEDGGVLERSGSKWTHCALEWVTTRPSQNII